MSDNAKTTKQERKEQAPFEDVLHYIWSREKKFYEGRGSQSVESVLTTMYALYMAAWAVGEITWEQAFYSYADFTAKFLRIR